MNRIATVQGATSGQARINAKRRARQEFWTEERRTVLVLVSVELEPYFRRQIKIMGDGARIDGSTQLEHAFALDFNVHIPGAPAKAVRAAPIIRSDWRDDHCTPVLVGMQWTDADGHPVIGS